MPKQKIYKRIYIEDFPIHNKGEFKDCIDWQSLNNTSIRFEYGNIKDKFIILYFDKKTEKILVDYKGVKIWCHRSTFKRNQLSKIVGTIQGDFRYKIGDIYSNDKKGSNFTIVDRHRIKNQKFYKYVCNNCGFDSRKETYYKGELLDYWKSESGLIKGISCPCCGLKQTFVQVGINDIPTTNPWMIPYFQGGYEEAKRYLAGSEAKIIFKCPNCEKLKDKAMAIYTLHKSKTISCSICSDGFSYPEKFVANVLNQLQVIYTTQYSPQWAKNKRYDFYLPYNNFIIEVDGGLGHGKKTFDNQIDVVGKQIDKLKENLANNNASLTVIRIQADESHFEYMKNNVIKSLFDIFDLSFINWNKCEEYALSSVVINVCNLFKQSYGINNIAEKYHINPHTVKRYLDKGYKIGLNPDYHVRKIAKVGDIIDTVTNS